MNEDEAVEYARLSAKLWELVEVAGDDDRSKLAALLAALPDADLPSLFGIALVELNSAKQPLRLRWSCDEH